MESLASSVLPYFTGDAFVSNAYAICDFRDDSELLKQWGAVCRRSFTWHTSWGETFTVYSAKHPTADAANSEACHLALKMGYKAPKWWQFWRYGDPALPPALPLVSQVLLLPSPPAPYKP